MADKGNRRADRDPTLELPSLFGRRRRRNQAAVNESPPPQATDTPPPEERTQPAPTERPAGVPPERRPTMTPEPATWDAEVPGQRRVPRSGPGLPPWAAVLVAGLLVGVLGTALTYGGLRGCEIVRGTDSCGGPGVGLLLVIVVVMILVGGVTLKLLGVAESTGLSFLGVGLTCVVVLVALLQSVFSPWMFVAVPVIAAVSFLVARWVTTRLIEPVDEGPTVDVR